MARKLTVVCIPDLHSPWTSWRHVEKVYDFMENNRVDVVCQLGDAVDFFSFSKFARSMDEIKPHEEIDLAREQLEGLWKRVHKILPKARKIQLVGNHGQRLYRRACERFPEVARLVSKLQDDIHTFPNVETIYDDRDGIVIEDTLYIHGYLTTLGAHMRALGCNVVHGHTHRSGIIMENWQGNVLTEMDCGFLADRNAVPLQYGPTKHMKWVESFGVVDKWGYKVIPVGKS